MYANQAVEWESIGFEPGFPSLSQFDCDQFATPGHAGACATASVAVGREGGIGIPGLSGLADMFAPIMSNPLGWASANMIPLAIGAAVGLMLGGMKR